MQATFSNKNNPSQMLKIISQIINRMKKKTLELAFTQQQVCVPHVICNTRPYRIYFTRTSGFFLRFGNFFAVTTKRQGLMARKDQGTTKKNKSMFSNVYNTIRSVLIYNSVVWSPILLRHRVRLEPSKLYKIAF